jgi:hypothetical protein
MRRLQNVLEEGNGVRAVRVETVAAGGISEVSFHAHFLSEGHISNPSAAAVGQAVSGTPFSVGTRKKSFKYFRWRMVFVKPDRKHLIEIQVAYFCLAA